MIFFYLRNCSKMRSSGKAHVHLQCAIEYLGFGMQNAEHEAYRKQMHKLEDRLEDIYGDAPAVAGVVHFAEITNLSTFGPNKVFCIGELHGLQISTTDYITQYKQLLTANDKSRSPHPIDFFIEVTNVPVEALVINKVLRMTAAHQWILRLRNHLRGCYHNLEDIEYITGVPGIANSPKFSPMLGKCPYEHTRVHWADPGDFTKMRSRTDQKDIYGISYQDNPEWLIEVKKVQMYKSDTSFEVFKKAFPHVTSHIKGEHQLYDIVAENPYIQDQLRRSVYRDLLFRSWFYKEIAIDKGACIESKFIKDHEIHEYWWRFGIFKARRRAVDLYTFLRMTRSPMSARGRFKNVIVHAGLAHTKAIVSLFRFVNNSDYPISIIERFAPNGIQEMKIDLCKAISFNMGGVVRKRAVRPLAPA